jgi:hypothetical protein
VIQQESAEEYYIRRDGFLRHIKDNVDPARVANGLQPLDETTARECFRILNDFWAKLDGLHNKSGPS